MKMADLSGKAPLAEVFVIKKSATFSTGMYCLTVVSVLMDSSLVRGYCPGIVMLHSMMVALTWQGRVMFSLGHTECCSANDAVTTEKF